MSQQEPTEEQMRAALEEQMRHIRVEDVLLQTIVTLINLGARRLGLTGPPETAGETDPEQARIAIEGARALMPLVPAEGTEPVRDALSQLQMAYVQAAEGGRPKAEGGQEGGQPSAEPEAATEEQAEREKARSKIWTPPGS